MSLVDKARIVEYASDPRITESVINDTRAQVAENRFRRDLAKRDKFIGIKLTPELLLQCDSALFQPMIDDALMYAVLSILNAQGIGNKGAGPITSASGDGLAKTAGYYSGRTISNDALITAEENYMAIMDDIRQTYRGECGSIKKIWSRTNEHYDPNYRAVLRDSRMRDG
jgi:hypothetical protein